MLYVCFFYALNFLFYMKFFWYFLHIKVKKIMKLDCVQNHQKIPRCLEKSLYTPCIANFVLCVFTIHQIDNYDKLCIKYLYYIFTIHPFFYKNICAFISSIYDIHIIIFSIPSTNFCYIPFFKSKCKVVFFCFPFQDL